MRAIFFDLDGTLLPMDFDVFVQTYFRLLAKRFSEYDPKAFIAGIWAGTKAMVENDGTMTNEARFWQTFAQAMGPDVLGREAEFEDFYHTDFHKVREVTGPNPMAKDIITLAKSKADLVVLATNPLFPPCAVESRLSWIGLKLEDFDYVTTYDNSSWCKPSLPYYRNICTALHLDPAECFMVGNDLREDGLGATQAGIRTHIVTDSLISHGLELNAFSHSTFAELPAYL